MKQVIEKQTAILERVEKILSNDRVIQLSQAALQYKTDRDLNKDEGETHKKLDSIHDVLKDSLTGDKNKTLNSNVIKLFEEVKKQTKAVKSLSNLVPVTPEQSKSILDKSRGNREFKSIGQRMKSAKEGVKDFFTGRGFLHHTGIAERGTGSIASEYLDAKEAVKKKAQARIDAGDPTVKLHGEKKSRKIFEKQETQAQQFRRDQGDDERKIESYKKMGVSEKQIAKSPESKRLQETAVKLAKVDPALRPEGFDVKTGMIDKTVAEKRTAKEAKATVVKDVKNKEAKAVALKEVTGKKEKSSEAKATVVKAVKNKEGDVITTGDVNNTTNNVVPIKASRVKKEKPEGATAAPAKLAKAMSMKEDVAESPAIGGLAATETASEAQRSIDMQIDLLTKIEENTRLPGGGAVKPKKEKEEGGGGMLDGILGFLGDGLMKSLKFMFSPKNILKFLGKIALPAMIIGSLVNGIMDGFKAFTETGSIGEALIAGLGGVLSFLSFGLFDAETIRSIVDAVSGFVDEYILDPVKNFFAFIGDAFEKYIMQPLADFFAPIADFFKSVKDQMLSMVESIGIPEISFTIPIIDKKVSIGPFYPFKKEAAKPQAGGAAPIAPGNSDAGAGRGSSQEAATDPRRLDAASSSVSAPKPAEGAKVYNKSAENAEAAGKPASAAPIIVSAPTTNNTTSKQNITMPTPIRNDDSGFNRYLSRHSGRA